MTRAENSDSSLVVERAQAADASPAEALLDDAARWLESRGIDQWKPGHFADEVRQTIASGELFVARRSGALIGCFMLDLQDPPAVRRWFAEQGRVAAPAAQLARLAVAREATGSGLGAELLDAACALAAQHELDYVRLHCPAENGRLRRYYLEAGFSYCGDVHTPGPNGEDWVISLFERPSRTVQR